jgi:hypothetical protein
MAIQVSCINKTPRNDPHLRIQNIGGINSDGTRWKLSEDEAIAGIERGEWGFYVNAGGQRAEVIIATHEGHKYLKTTADGLHPNNLLALSECP